MTFLEVLTGRGNIRFKGTRIHRAQPLLELPISEVTPAEFRVIEAFRPLFQ
jgi:hypothetical protein